MTNKSISIIILMLLQSFAFQMHGQSLRSYKKAGNKAFEQANYYGAADMYRNYLKSDTTDNDLIFNYSISCFNNREYHESAKWFKTIIQRDSMAHVNAYYYLAECNKHFGKYNTASDFYTEYIKFTSDSTGYLYLKSMYEIQNMGKVKTLAKETSDISVEHLPDEINSVFSEYGTIPLDDTTFLFTSTRPLRFDSSNYATTLYYGIQKDGEWTESNFWDSLFYDPVLHVSNPVFNTSRSSIYYSVCPNYKYLQEIDSTLENFTSCKILKQNRIDSNWSEPVDLKGDLYRSNSNTIQPFITMIDGTEILFFSSDRKGGIGKFDVYYCRLYENDSTGNITNAGDSVNSHADDICPFFDHRDSTLYFSSQWHKNLGGFDIFKSKGWPGSFQNPVNMGKPVNSSYDEVYYSIDSLKYLAFLSSNRPGSRTFEEEACCNDIYYYELPRPEEPTQPDSSELISVHQKSAFDTLTIQDKEKIQNLDSIFQTVSNTEISTGKGTELLVLNLFFDNDKPDPRTYASSTQKNYYNLVNQYLQQKEACSQSYSNGLYGLDKVNATNEIEQFFESRILPASTQIQKFAQKIGVELQQGKIIQLTIKAFASPLSSSSYNYKLSKRRIQSFVNYLFAYNNGSLIKYKQSGTLTIHKVPNGEKFAPEHISDKVSDKRNSVYHPIAMNERRIEVYISIKIE